MKNGKDEERKKNRRGRGEKEERIEEGEKKKG